MRKKAPRSSVSTPLKEVIEQMLVTYKLRDRMHEMRAIQAWEKVVGEVVARHTERLYIRNRTLFVKVNSSVVRNELLYARKKILVSLNKAAGEVVIDEIVLS